MDRRQFPRFRTACRRRIGVLGPRETPLPHIGRVFPRRGADFLAQGSLAPDEFRGEFGEDAEQVVGHEDLPVAGR